MRHINERHFNESFTIEDIIETIDSNRLSNLVRWDDKKNPRFAEFSNRNISIRVIKNTLKIKLEPMDVEFTYDISRLKGFWFNGAYFSIECDGGSVSIRIA